MAWTRPRRLASQQPSMLIDLSPGPHVRWRPPSVNTSNDQSFPQLSGIRLSPLCFYFRGRCDPLSNPGR